MLVAIYHLYVIGTRANFLLTVLHNAHSGMQWPLFGHNCGAIIQYHS